MINISEEVTHYCADKWKICSFIKLGEKVFQTAFTIPEGAIDILTEGPESMLALILEANVAAIKQQLVAVLLKTTKEAEEQVDKANFIRVMLSLPTIDREDELFPMGEV